MHITPSHRKLQFGEFSADLQTGELCRSGGAKPFLLAEQLLQVLQMLLKQPGEMVCRDDLIRTLWPGGGLGDFDHGLNKAVNKLRDVLGDSAESPKFIETVARRGYRFIAHVTAGTASPLVAISTGDTLQKGAQIRSLAVLPFDNLSGEPAQDYFADGITEALITELGRISALRVISRQSIVQYKGTKKTVPQIADELNIDAIVEGSVLRAGHRVRVTVQLIQASPERHVWADSYDRDTRDVLSIHSEIARTVANEVRVSLTPQEQARLTEVRAVHPAANEIYWRGRYFLGRRTKQDTNEALVDFQQAIDLDPTFAAAYASLSEAYLNAALYDLPHWQELSAKAHAASLKALALDDSLSMAHYTLAAQRARLWDWAGAEKGYRRAIELNPSNASAHVWYADLLTILGRVPEGESEIRRAQELDPLSLEVYGAATLPLYYGRRYNQLIEHCEGWVKRNANLEWNYHHGLGAAYVQMGKHQEAIAELREALKCSTM